MTARRQPRVAPKVNQIVPPADTRALSTLSRIDYEDAFTISTEVDRTPEQWARAMIEDAPPRVRAGLLAGWLGLGLKLGQPWSSRHVLGWPVKRREPGWILLRADSWLGLHGELLFRSEPTGVLFATRIQHTNLAARTVWSSVTDRHQRVVESLLRHAAHREQER